jgi:hypothetical protein
MSEAPENDAHEDQTPENDAPEDQVSEDQAPESAQGDLPPIPDDVREAARLAPDHWLGMVDPTWVSDDPPPEWAVIGEWRSGLSGEVEEWRPNSEYRPSPLMLEWPEPSDPVDALLQLAATGYGSLDDAVRALSSADVTVLQAPDGSALTATGPDGTPVVPVFTSQPHQTFAGALIHSTVPAAELAARLASADTALCVNPASPAHTVISADDVLGAIDTTAAAEGDAAPVPFSTTSTERTP